MASLVTRLTRAKPSLRLLAPLNAILAPQPPLPQIPNLGSSQTLIFGDKFESPPPSSQIVFPSFPFGYGVTNPVVSATEMESFVSEDSRTVWADSTKQKRKKKMNKHKVQKRRRLLRRKSKT